MEFSASFVDTTSGLSQVKFYLLDSNNQFMTVVENLDEGASRQPETYFPRTIKLFGSKLTETFGIPAKTLKIGSYTLKVEVQDIAGNTTTQDFAFYARGTAANYEELYLRGTPTDWGAGLEFTLTGDNTWVLNGVQLDETSEFKLTLDSTDWDAGELAAGADGCSGELVASGGGNISGCVTEAGTYNIIFNDASNTLSFVKLTSNFPEMYVSGTFNGWTTQDPMALVDNNTWSVIITVEEADGTPFKFRGDEDWTDDWGADDCAGPATYKGGDITGCITGPGNYRLTFNDETLAFSIQQQ
jgi:hypothetical protein